MSKKKCQFHGYAFIYFVEMEQAVEFSKQTFHYKNTLLECKFPVDRDKYIKQCIQDLRNPRKVFADKIPKSYRYNEIKCMFSGFGKVQSVILLNSHDKPINQAMVTFQEYHSAYKCVTKHIINTRDGASITAFYAQPKFSEYMLLSVDGKIRSYIREVQKRKKTYIPEEFRLLHDEYLIRSADKQKKYTKPNMKGYENYQLGLKERDFANCFDEGFGENVSEGNPNSAEYYEQYGALELGEILDHEKEFQEQNEYYYQKNSADSSASHKNFPSKNSDTQGFTGQMQYGGFNYDFPKNSGQNSEVSPQDVNFKKKNLSDHSQSQKNTNSAKNDQFFENHGVKTDYGYQNSFETNFTQNTTEYFTTECVNYYSTNEPINKNNQKNPNGVYENNYSEQQQYNNYNQHQENFSTNKFVNEKDQQNMYDQNYYASDNNQHNTNSFNSYQVNQQVSDCYGQYSQNQANCNTNQYATQEEYHKNYQYNQPDSMYTYDYEQYTNSRTYYDQYQDNNCYYNYQGVQDNSKGNMYNWQNSSNDQNSMYNNGSGKQPVNDTYYNAKPLVYDQATRSEIKPDSNYEDGVTENYYNNNIAISTPVNTLMKVQEKEGLKSNEQE